MSCPKKRKIEQDDYNLEQLYYPVLPDELIEPIPLIEVYIDTVSNPKFISKVVVELNSILPLPQLAHLKRIKQRDVLLGAYSDYDNSIDVFNFLKSKSFDTTVFENNVRKVSVAENAPKTRKQYEVVNKLWPCNFHSNKYVEKLCTNSLFSAIENENHVKYMKLAIDVARFSSGEVKIGVVVVDPQLNSVVAVGFDKRNINPCEHAIMVAISNVALTQSTEVNSELESEMDISGIPNDILIELKQSYENMKFGARKFKSKNEIANPSDGPYLCTGYVVYATHEPCIMCSMGLIHSRIKRIFYGTKSKKGGLGTLCKIHTIKDLNHHYEVFAGLLDENCKKL